jgi:hypothetical protein
MGSNSYKRFVNIVNGKQQLQKVCEHSNFSFKFAYDGSCRTIVTMGWYANKR